MQRVLHVQEKMLVTPAHAGGDFGLVEGPCLEQWVYYPENC